MFDFWRCLISKDTLLATDASQAERLASARKFAIEAARTASNTRCGNVVVLDVSSVSPVTDFFVLATGSSPRQMRSVCKDIEEAGGPLNYHAFSKSSYESDHWILIDFFDVVVHVFNQEAREFYDLDNLWGDAKKVDWK